MELQALPVLCATEPEHLRRSSADAPRGQDLIVSGSVRSSEVIMILSILLEGQDAFL